MAVQAFLEERIPFTAIADVVARALEAMPARPPADFEDLFDTDAEARRVAAELCEHAGATR